MRTLKSTLGLALAACVLLAFAAAWILATRANAGFLDQQWLFFTALPYNLLLVAIFGESNFSADAPQQVVTAALSEAAVVYVIGACLQTVALALWRLARGTNARA